MNKKYDVIIVGGGIIGAATARELSKYKLDVLLLERNNHFGGETTTGNSGVIHVGFDAVPGTLKAKHNIEGRQLYFNEVFPNIEFRKAEVPSLIIALRAHKSKEAKGFENIERKSEMEHIHLLYKRGIKNGIDPSEMKILSKEETLEIEPNVNPEIEGSLFAPHSWAVHGPEVTGAFIGNALDNGLHAEVKKDVTLIDVKEDEVVVKVADGATYTAKCLIDAAGHYADTLAHIAGVDDFKQKTRRGEYRVLEKTEAGVVRNIVFKTPTIFGKGVVVAPTLTGHVLVGPTALENVPKDETRLVTPEMYDEIGIIGRDMVPNLRIEKTSIRYSGSRPVDIESNDFVIRASKKSKRFIILGGMQSPALASAPSIAKAAVDLVGEAGIELVKKTNFIKEWSPKLPVVV